MYPCKLISVHACLTSFHEEFCHTGPKLTNVVQLRSDSADKLWPQGAFYTPTRSSDHPSVQPTVQPSDCHHKTLKLSPQPYKAYIQLTDITFLKLNDELRMVSDLIHLSTLLVFAKVTYQVDHILMSSIFKCFKKSRCDLPTETINSFYYPDIDQLHLALSIALLVIPSIRQYSEIF